jgi:hypothetical protein
VIERRSDFTDGARNARTGPLLDQAQHATGLDDFGDRSWKGFGIGSDTAAEVQVVFGDDPERVRSDAAFAKLSRVVGLVG